MTVEESTSIQWVKASPSWLYSPGESQVGYTQLPLYDIYVGVFFCIYSVNIVSIHKVLWNRLDSFIYII